MDANDFQTIGECDIGYIWKVSSENKVVVNIGKVALYFEIDEFFVFAKMIDDSVKNLVNEDVSLKKHLNKEDKPKISNITQFRSKERENDE